jgi:cathepsin A (carboxypeptidase C)
MGNKAWTLALPWSGHSKFSAATDVNWLYTKENEVSATKGGLVRTAKASKGEGSLTFLQVFEAGHMVPMDQPQAALALLNQFLTNTF